MAPTNPRTDNSKPTFINLVLEGVKVMLAKMYFKIPSSPNSLMYLAKSKELGIKKGFVNWLKIDKNDLFVAKALLDGIPLINASSINRYALSKLARKISTRKMENLNNCFLEGILSKIIAAQNI